MTTIAIPPTGRQTIALDWAADLAVPPRCGATLQSAIWTLPAGITQQSASLSGSKATITLNCTDLRAGRTYTLICVATLSNGDVIPASVDCLATNRKTQLSSERCPT